MQVSFPGQENQVHNQMSTSELKASEMPFLSNTNTQDSKPKEKAPRKHKMPLTAKGKPSGPQQGEVGVVRDGQVLRAELS